MAEPECRPENLGFPLEKRLPRRTVLLVLVTCGFFWAAVVTLAITI